jgi:hydrogenase-4 component B
MSGAMIKMAVYALLRFGLLAAPVPAAAAGACVAVGAATALVGIVLATTPRDIKRVLAYSSIENIGFVTAGVGTGLLGQAFGRPALAAAGFAAALAHVLQHALLKGSLFLSAGSLVHALATRDLEHMGGLFKRWPRAAGAALVASLGLAGLPPLGLFLAEWLLFRALLAGATTLPPPYAALAAGAIAVLALATGVALLSFCRLAGVALLGAPRPAHSDSSAHAPGALFWVPPWVLVAASTALALAPWALVALVYAPVAQLVGAGAPPAAGLVAAFVPFARALLVLVGTVAALLAARALLLRGAPVRSGPTWACGYRGAPRRMHYTAGSFAQPLHSMLARLLPWRVVAEDPAGLFPAHARREVEGRDPVEQGLVEPAVGLLRAAVRTLDARFRGTVRVYVVYLLGTVVALLAWQFGFRW